MAYTPTLADLPPEEAYTPTLSDIPHDGGGFLSSTLNSPGLQAILGTGDALRNTLAGAANLTHIPQLLSGSPLPLAHTGSGTAYNIGNIAGNVGGFLGGGELLDAARAGAAALPLAGKAMQWLGGGGLTGLTRRALGSAAYGAVNDPNNRLGGAAEGAALSGVADAVPAAANWINKGVQYLQPEKYAKSIIQNLGDGQTLQDATKSVINDIKSAYEQQGNKADELYDSVHNSVRSSPIYDKVTPPDPAIFGTVAPTISGQYRNLSPQTFQNYSSDLSDLHNQFLSNPTFDNAHKLQSQIGTELGSLQNNRFAPDISTINAIQSLGKARNALKTDMTNFLSNQDPVLAQKYQDASDYFLNNVVPYRSNPKIYQIASGEKTNIKPATLANMFSAPDENLLKVMGDLPQSSINKILYTKLGQFAPASSAQKLSNLSQTLDQQGLGNYVSPDLQAQLNELKNRITAKNAAQSGAGGLLGAAIGSHGGLPEAIGLGASGAALGRPIMSYLGNKLPLDAIANFAHRGAQIAYPYARNIALANILANNGGQQ